MLAILIYRWREQFMPAHQQFPHRCHARDLDASAVLIDGRSCLWDALGVVHLRWGGAGVIAGLRSDPSELTRR